MKLLHCYHKELYIGGGGLTSESVIPVENNNLQGEGDNSARQFTTQKIHWKHN